MPHAIYISNTNITSYDSSRPQQEDGTAGENWIFVTKEQYDYAKTLLRPQWDGENVIEGTEPPPYIPPVPVLTPRQLRLWLVSSGISISTIENFINAIHDPIEKEKAQIEWEYASEYKIDHPLVIAIGQALGMTEEQMNNGFREASEL